MSRAAAIPLLTQVAAVRIADRVSPAAAARLAYPLFRRVGPRLGIRAEQQAVHDAARRRTLSVRGRDVVTYEWGAGSETVLLVHGWRGRAAQFAPLVRELRSEGYRVVAFDAPANGDSRGRRTDVRDWLAAIAGLHTREGRFHSIVGHSFGAMAALAAVKEGVSAGSVVSLAGVSDARYLVTGFGERIGLSREAMDALAATFAENVFGVPDPWPRFDGAATPLPDGTALLVIHDSDDREVSVDQAVRLHDAHPGRSRLVLTSGFGHNRILGSDPALDATLELVKEGLVTVDAL